MTCFNSSLHNWYFVIIKTPIHVCFQYVSSSIVLLTTFLSIGLMFGFSAILLPQLEAEGIMEAKSEEASWIGDTF